MLKSLLCAALLLAGGGAWAAQVVGVVAHLSGPLLDRKADGSVKVLGPKSEIENGDTLVSEKNTYAQIRFVDNSEITLKPGTTFRVENFNYDAGKPEADSAAFDLVKGGLRSITGLLGKRNKEKFSLKTPSATIGIRGTTFLAQYVPPPAEVPGGPSTPTVPVLPPGLHVSVTEGAIVVTNNGGSLGFQAGQFGYVPGVNQAPVIVPPNPGLQFTPPPSFNGGASGPQASNSGSSPDKGGVDCIVR
ncbi:FecR family protein [Massilia aerilata]|uniref:FecR domain-containing protein n=1 Tax=Massilia aerilata TaxID=453817 RepID=A0ABW0RXI8_9BURK